MTPSQSAKTAPPSSHKPKFPNMNEFSPGVLKIGIRDLLVRLAPKQGSRAALEAEIQGIGTIRRTTDSTQRRKRAANVLIGMSECELFDLGSNKFTDLAQDIASKTPSEAALAFALHILQNLHGDVLVSVVQELRDRAERITNAAFRRVLTARGFRLTHNEADFGKLRRWLEESGVVDSEWNFDDAILTNLTGTTSAILRELYFSDTPARRVAE